MAVTLATMTATAQETVVRRPECGTVEAAAHPEEMCACRTARCLSREQAAQVVLDHRELVDCRSELEECRKKTPPPPPDPDRWTTGEVVVLVVGVAAGALALGTGIGYGLARLEQAGRL